MKPILSIKFYNYIPLLFYITQALWSATTEFKTYPQLQEEIGVDVAIVGGGLTGITTAYALAKAGKEIAVLECI